MLGGHPGAILEVCLARVPINPRFIVALQHLPNTHQFPNRVQCDSKNKGLPSPAGYQQTSTHSLLPSIAIPLDSECRRLLLLVCLLKEKMAVIFFKGGTDLASVLTIADSSIVSRRSVLSVPWGDGPPSRLTERTKRSHREQSHTQLAPRTACPFLRQEEERTGWRWSSCFVSCFNGTIEVRVRGFPWGVLRYLTVLDHQTRNPS